MNIPTVKGQRRKVAGSRAATRLRRDGKLPAIVYGHKKDPEPVALESHELTQHLQRGAHLLNLDLDGQQQPCLIKEAQYDYLGTNLVHLDLARVDLSEKVKVHVPVEYRGTPKGIADGGVLRTEAPDLEVECIVSRIPDKIRIDVSHLALNEVMYVKDLKLDEGLTAASDPDKVVATVRLPLQKVEAATPEGAAPTAASTEPEVIAKGKIEEEGEEGAAAAPKEKKEEKKKDEKKK